MLHQKLLYVGLVILLPHLRSHLLEKAVHNYRLPKKILECSMEVQDVKSTKKNYVCLTRECVHIASLITNNIDPRVNPCNDFYKFACGRVKKNNDNLFSVAHSLTIMRIRSLLTSAINKSDIPPLQMAKDFYKSCINDQYSQTNPLFPIYKKIQELGEWPLSSEKSENEDSLMSILRKARDLGFESNSILGLYILPDAINTNIRRLVVTPPIFNLPVNNKDKLEYVKLIYFKLMLSIGLQFVQYSSSQLGYLKYERIIEEKIILFTEVLEFELALVKIFPQSWNDKDVYEAYVNLTINEAQTRYPFINWLNFLQSQLGSSVQLNGDDYFIISGEEYFKNLQILFTQTSKRIIMNYVIWRYIFFSLKVSFVLSPEERWRNCLSITLEGFSIVLNPKYIQKYLPEENRRSAIEMVQKMKNIMLNTFSNYKWIDESTRKRILDKINSVIVRVGYSEEMLTSNDEYTELYSTLQIDSTDYYSSALNISKFILDFIASTLPKPIDKRKWPFYVSTLVVNAFYIPVDNSITIPAALLQEEIYSTDTPQYWNYGTVGFVIGHELSHALDNLGRQFDKHGVRKSWWHSNVEKIFEKKAQCFIDQYNSYNNEKIQVNGEITLGENIADNEGILKAYDAYHNWITEHEEDKLLPKLKYTPQQLFWISSANLWCRNEIFQGLGVENDPHAPPRARVIGMVSNQEAFAKDFSCSQETKMNPTKKCTF